MKIGRPRIHTPRPDRVRHLLNRIFAMGRRYERERAYWRGEIDSPHAKPVIEALAQAELLGRRVVRMTEKMR